MKNYSKILFAVALVFGFSSSAVSAAEHTVKKGETMWLIAKKYHVPFSEILRLNSHYKNVDLIHPNDKIIIPDAAQTTDKGESTTANASQAEAVLSLVNAERKKQGLQPLQLLSSLNKVANMKAQDMAAKNYFSHNSPTYGTSFEMLKSQGIHYMSAGENIAKGQKDAQAVMTAWMNSAGHRQNILSPAFEYMGLGYYKSGSSPIWVQIFTGN